jgi:hypothetical protein
MRIPSLVCRLLAAGVLIAAAAPDVWAQLPPAPIPAVAPGSSDLNLFYGGVPPLVGAKAPVLVFVHGLRGRAQDWWADNDMYQVVFNWGFRSAYVGLSADNSPNDASIATNAAVIRNLLPKIAAHFQTPRLYLIGHSKGGIDIQAALLDPAVAPLAKAVFMISTPNQGTELADWAFENPAIAAGMGLLTPGVAALKTDSMSAFRAFADPRLKALGIPFYTIAGNRWLDNPLTLATGAILLGQIGLKNIDGFVSVERTGLSPNYAADLGVVPAHHFQTDSGGVSFPKINQRIQGLETSFDEFERLATNGFSEFGGDSHNSWAWSMKWFKGKLYVGTGREVTCLSLLASDTQAGTNTYPLSVASGQCPPGDEVWRELAAEIWQYTPWTKRWKRVFKSPESVPIAFTPGGLPIAFTARDSGFRGMAIFRESDGTDALYVGGVTPGSVFDKIAPYDTEGYPPPRMLRTVDGETFAPIPQAAGTFLGEIGKGTPNSPKKFRSFRSMVVYNGRLYATLADFLGVGVVISSVNPSEGNDAWSQASGSYDDFPTWGLQAFNGQLYATTGKTALQDSAVQGYGVHRTNGVGPWIPVVTHGGNQPIKMLRSPNGLSMTVFKGQLYVGTNRPTELIRVNPDDTWDLIVGEPRNTPQGPKVPLSGLGIGFGSWFQGHFWRMGVHGDHLYLGTWDWSIGLNSVGFAGLDKLFGYNYGFDLFRTADGVHWTAVSQTGLGDPFNYGGRTFESTPFGLFFGTARQRGGLQVLVTQGPNEGSLAPPRELRAASQFFVGSSVQLSWKASPGAVRYRVYRATVKPLKELMASDSPLMQDPEVVALIEEVRAGTYDAVCPPAADSALCETVRQIRALLQGGETQGQLPNPAAFPLPYGVVGITANLHFDEPAPSALQSIYYVRAENAQGLLSGPSNLAGGPSKFLNGSPPVAACQDVTVTCTNAACTAPGSINSGSFDEDGDALRFVQTPAGPYGLGTTNVTLTVHGPVASASCTASVTVVDNQPPDVTAPPDVTLTTGPSATMCAAAPVDEGALGLAAVSDNCSVVSRVREGVPAGTFFPVGATAVTYTAVDESGNRASAVQTVTVLDDTAPMLTPPADVSVPAAAGLCSAAVPLAPPSARDNCSLGTLTSDAAAGNTFAVGSTRVTWTATDVHGNRATAAHTVIVTDTQGPVISREHATPRFVWPPNHKLVEIFLGHTVTDNCGRPVRVQLAVSVTGPDRKQPQDGPDWIIVNPRLIRIRADRWKGNRVYTIAIKATDQAGNTTVKPLAVVAPRHHDQDGCERGDRDHDRDRDREKRTTRNDRQQHGRDDRQRTGR